MCSDAIVVTDRDGRIVRVNKAADKLLGYNHEELLGQSVELIVPDRLRAAHVVKRESEPVRHHARAFGSGLELYARRKDGSDFLADIMLSPLEVEGEWLAVAVVRDVTTRKEAEDKLRSSEENLRLLVEGVRDYALFRLDVEGRVVSWNATAQRIKGTAQMKSSANPSPSLRAGGHAARETSAAPEGGRRTGSGGRQRTETTERRVKVLGERNYHRIEG